MVNYLTNQLKKRGLIWLETIGSSIFIILAMIISIDILRMPKGDPLKIVALTTINDKTIPLINKSQPTILYFWGNWCVFCRHTSPTIEKLYQQGYPVISVAMQSGTDAEVKAYLKEHDLQFPVINDQKGEISEVFSVVAVPTIAIVNNGKISMATSGWTSEYGLKLRLWLVKLLSKF